MEKFKCAYDELVDLNKLVPHPKNPNKHPKEQIERLSQIIDFQGKRKAIVVSNRSGFIIKGHGCLEALKLLGWKQGAVDYQDYDSEAQEYADMVADNEIAKWADQDQEMISLEIPNLDIDTNMLGMKEIPNIVDEENVKEDEIPEKVEERCKKGDKWKLGENYIFCGDSTNPQDVERLIGDNTAKMIFTSPPYNMNGGLYSEYGDNKGSKEYIDFNLDIINLWKTYLNGYLFWNISYNKNTRCEFIEIFYRIMKETGLKFIELIVWDKGHGIPITSKEMLTRQYEDILAVGNEEIISKELELYYLGSLNSRGYFNKKKGKGITNYWKIDTANCQLQNHKACYPVKLPAKAIGLTTEKEDIVLDPFLGSGTTLIACEQLGRKCFGMELEPKYCDVIIQRWENLTGKKAERIKNEDN